MKTIFIGTLILLSCSPHWYVWAIWWLFVAIDFIYEGLNERAEMRQNDAERALLEKIIESLDTERSVLNTFNENQRTHNGILQKIAIILKAN